MEEGRPVCDLEIGGALIGKSSDWTRERGNGGTAARLQHVSKTGGGSSGVGGARD
jgi:hypothetical protein